MATHSEPMHDANVDIKRLKIEGENFYCISNYDELRTILEEKSKFYQ